MRIFKKHLKYEYYNAFFCRILLLANLPLVTLPWRFLKDPGKTH
jgi:hypothetical protein